MHNLKYYIYDKPMQTPIFGPDRFRSAAIEPQFWPKDHNYMNKNIVVVGSGATAITLLPNLV